MKVEIKGTIKLAEQPVQMKNFRLQNVVISKPPFRNEFGEEVGPAQHYKVQLFNEMIDQLNLRDKVGKRVHATCYLNGREFNNNGGIDYALNLKVIKLEMVS